MQEANRSQREYEEEEATKNMGNNDPVAYAEFTSANDWEGIPQDNITVLAI